MAQAGRTHETDRERLRALREMPAERKRAARSLMVQAAVSIVCCDSPQGRQMLGGWLANVLPDLAAEEDAPFLALRLAADRYAEAAAAGGHLDDARGRLRRAVALYFIERADETRARWSGAAGGAD